ncbi:hypothetical protein ZIOFF_036661 [Zingiber officinale]|uniref:Uncharacterized protein n=1 Tax=Zingiber officinale TaxID=94328 RepID=A0A8J5GAC8_ZINOF|nr:hypothetical protein ZIOFF_036661 [Zingiber officinale]
MFELSFHVDRLLIPPEISPFSFSEARDGQTLKAAPKNKSNARSVTGKASRFSVSQSEKNTSAKPTRSSSTATSALSTALSSSTCLSNSSRTAILNTSTASVTSKPSFSGNRSTAISRHSAPAKSRPNLPSNPDKPKQPQNSRPCTPSARPSSRSSTPARRATTEASPRALTRSASVGHAPPANRQNSGSANRPSSPAPRERPQVQAPALQRRGTASVARAGSNPEMNSIKQSSSPIVVGGRLQENPPSARSNGKANEGKAAVNRRPMSAEPASRRPINPSSPTENTGSAVRKPTKHTVVEIKQSTAGNPAISLFPQSIRSAAQKNRSYRLSETEISAPAPGKVTPRHVDNNGVAVAL